MATVRPLASAERIAFRPSAAYLVQYFRNIRLEYHPELAGTPNGVSPGLIGRQYLHQRGWL